MAVGRTTSIALQGLDGALVEVEADVSSGLPGFVVIGLPDTSLGESKDRVRAAAANTGHPIGAKKLTINLSPASLPKHGSAFDLAIALAALAADGLVPRESIARVVHLGELGLDGRLRPTRGVLPAVLAAARGGASIVMVPSGDAEEAALVPGVRVVPVASLREAAIWHGAELAAEPVEAVLRPAVATSEGEPEPDLAEVVGNADAVEAVQVAAAGGHHMLLLGPPGAGKTMLAERLPGILPDLETSAALEVSSLRSLCGLPIGGELRVRPPLEAPHHTASPTSIVGGGSAVIRPGAAARASHGVLFLDEAPEFSPAALDALRQPLESGRITIHRANAAASFPARFQLVLAANPCPCGQAGAKDAECICSPNARRRYLARMSGPLLDRIDIQLRVPKVTAAQLRLAAGESRTTTALARERVARARAAAAARLDRTPWRRNAEVPGSVLRSPLGSPERAAARVLDRALERGLVTMRGHDRVLRTAWTLADLDGAERPGEDHVARALILRRSAS
ncbi:YifB family Mg chelatase-like AAA ATPase [Homoserinibacter sp. YIM 151385]|uniref:YifB family Mg chelatase-like AAA ATPase n=1 Tax=Homoserinibacter sp. YIM 151385 TaxID=2985506 RepID=UPI0022F08094|nr:YifB family Mg chelatase-like AAA ATPase [Homoserinibacter sp. YIM 151385]WBU39169.1 YifB family Mg chelatase-like AAA ATPase [Homoserinibacter sp. YIM 151385]